MKLDEYALTNHILFLIGLICMFSTTDSNLLIGTIGIFITIGSIIMYIVRWVYGKGKTMHQGYKNLKK